MVEHSTPQGAGSTDVMSELARRLAGVASVRFALLFGSRAAGRPRTDSDWDLAVYLSDALSAEERFSERLRLAAELEDLGCIDLVVLNEAPPLLAQRALQGQRILVEDPVAYVRFFVRTEAAAGDERYWRQIHLEARRRRLEEGRFGRP
jgi:predicted nucleotidyltransferase